MQDIIHNMKTFLICHRGALGDFILTWPALLCLRKTLSDYHFLGIGRPEYMRLAITLDLLDTYLDNESSELLDFFCGKRIPEEIGTPQGAVLWLTNGQETVNILKKSASLPVICIPPFPTKQIHLSHYYRSVIQTHFNMIIPPGHSDYLPTRTTENQYALIHPGSGSLKKNYNTLLYRDLAKLLRQTGYQKVSFIFGPVEDEKMNKEDFAGECIERPKDVEALADLLSCASLYIGNDSGVSHLSGFLGIPTIALYKSTDPEVWGVLGKKVVYIRSNEEKSALHMIKECLRSL
ncbi:ADP-heptose:LPS heptosyltransferase [Candidatus Scalindua japonica]|uniref:ADP-heptose:LPS heptosyltransferase n=1 Tax=Candidatus Scalindua japonica TaxID=1284222 RepID=A0A286TXX3_9BACT|nr:glycosyltransferase family 9 protein [Candidatus Scalindua japonica]GAX60759.1 ADP-heptose:LPS heptosyltransferase [Candidatus Scalindua japonica]